MDLDTFLAQQLAGQLSHDAKENRFAFSYAPSWLENPQRYALSPQLPLVRVADQTPEAHSAAVRHFFENLLPEGRALDDAAATNKVSKSNLVGLMVALGRETAGAISMFPSRDDGSIKASARAYDAVARRALTKAEMSERIRERPHQPFSVWDGKVRLSIAGYQDKVAVLSEAGDWFLVEGDCLASTTILKPEPYAGSLAGLTSNEFFCMRLAKNVGLPVAEVRLTHVPEPVLEIDRFDRSVQGDRVHRLHIIDGCQLLGIPPLMKYERPYGNSRDVKHVRAGASLPQLFDSLHLSATPAAQRLQLLRWVLFQAMIGNTDAHAKNISFFYDHKGLRMTPAYDLVSTLAFGDGKLEDSFAMAIGDAFTESELNPYEWAYFAFQCNLTPRLVSSEMLKMANLLLQVLDRTRSEVFAEGADGATVEKILPIVERLTRRHLAIAPEIPKIDAGSFT